MAFIGGWFYLFCVFGIVIIWLIPNNQRAHAYLALGVLWSLCFQGVLITVAIAVIVLFLYIFSRLSAQVQSDRKILQGFVLLLVSVLIFIKIPQSSEKKWLKWIPLGFSYLIFEWIHVLADQLRGKAGTVFSLADFGRMTFCFPFGGAGPVKRISEQTTAIAGLGFPGSQEVMFGLTRTLIGLFKKLVIAESFLPLFSEGVPLTHLHPLYAGAILYVSTYLDLSAYADIICGVTRMIGVRFPENMNWPLGARSIIDFWNRWHMTLTRWFRDYIGFTLLSFWGGRAGDFFATILTMMLVGAWHGLSVSFLFWGLFHGVLLALTKVVNRLDWFVTQNRAIQVFGWLTTQLLVTFSFTLLIYTPVELLKRILMSFKS